MAGQEIPIGTIHKRLTDLLADVSMLLKELAEKRALLQEIEAEAAGQSHALDARKSLIESPRGDSERAQALEVQLEQKRFMISTMEQTINRYATTNSELQQSLTAWKEKYAALKSSGPAAEPAIAPALPELGAEELRPLENEEAVGGDATLRMDMREILREARQMGIPKK